MILAGNWDNYKSLDEFKFRRNSTTNFGVSCPRASEKSDNKLVSTLSPSFLIGSSSFLQVTRTTIKSQMSLKFGRIQPWTAELAALDQFKKNLLFKNIQNILMTCCQVSDRCPLGYLFIVKLGFTGVYSFFVFCSKT